MSATDSYLRLAMMFRDNHAHHFKTKLEKMAEIILFENTPIAMTAEEMITALRDEYSLHFTDTEITNAIEGPRGSNNIICINPESRRQGSKKYILTEKTATEIEKRSTGISIANFCSLYASEQSDLSIDETQLEDLLCRYFHQCFIHHANTIMKLITRDQTERAFLTGSNIDEDFTAEEKETINRFIYWDNPEKDKFVCQMVACCFDYCSMTVRTDSTIFETVLKEKNFVLDTDIISCMIGINKGAGKQAMNAFIKKSNEAGIRMAITNFTRDETADTINRNVNRIRDLSGNSQPLHPSLIRECADTGIDEVFYQSYYEWSQTDSHRNDSIEEFRKDLIQSTESVCQPFIAISGIPYSETKAELFESLSQNLHEYKTIHKEPSKIDIIKTEVNNYLLISEKNERAGMQNSPGLNYYLISADRSFCHWARETHPDAIPKVIPPSVWYSILLHYSSRATKDYAAFTRFLNIHSTTDEVRQDEKKTLLLKKISQLNEPIDIKERIMLEAGKKLSDEYTDADDTTIDNLIRESNTAVTEQKAAENTAKKERDQKQDLEKQLAELKTEVSQMMHQHKQEILEIKKNNQQTKAQYEIKIRNLQTAFAQREKEMRQEEKNRYYKQSAEASAKQKKQHYIFAFTIMIFIIVSIIVLACILFLKKNEIPEEIYIGVSIGLGLFAITDLILILHFYKGRFCSFHTDKIIEKELKRIKRENENGNPV